MKAIALVRVSTERQSYDEQDRELNEFILNDDVKYTEVIQVAEKESGRKYSEEDRKGIKRAKDLILSDGDITCVYAWSIDRISRRKAVLFSLVEWLQHHKIQLQILNPKIKMFDIVDGEFVVNDFADSTFSMYAQLAESEMKNRIAKFKRTFKVYAETGHYQGGDVLFGYTLDDNKLYIPHPENAKIVCDIFDLYVNSNLSALQIEREFADRGVKIGYEKVRKILKNVAYTGKKTAKESKLTRIYPPLISEELFKKAQESARSKATCVDKVRRTDVLCSKLIVCPDCGRYYTPSNGYYVCSSKANRRGCNSKQALSIKNIDGKVWLFAKMWYSTWVANDSEETKKALQEENKVLLQKISKLEKDLDGADEKKEKAGVLFENGIKYKTKQELLNRWAEIDAETEEIKTLSTGLKNTLSRNIRAIDELSVTVDLNSRFQGAFSSEIEEYKVKYDIIHKFVNKIEFKLVYITVLGKEYEGVELTISPTFNVIGKVALDPQVLYYIPKRLKGQWVISDVENIKERGGK